MRTSAVSWCCHRSTSQKLQEMDMAWWTGIFTGLSSPFLAPPQWYKTPGWSCRIPISSHESVSCVRHQLSLLTTNASNFAWDTLLNEQNKKQGKPPTPTSQFQSLQDSKTNKSPQRPKQVFLAHALAIRHTSSHLSVAETVRSGEGVEGSKWVTVWQRFGGSSTILCSRVFQNERLKSPSTSSDPRDPSGFSRQKLTDFKTSRMAVFSLQSLYTGCLRARSEHPKWGRHKKLGEVPNFQP